MCFPVVRVRRFEKSLRKTKMAPLNVKDIYVNIAQASESVLTFLARRGFVRPGTVQKTFTMESNEEKVSRHACNSEIVWPTLRFHAHHDKFTAAPDEFGSDSRLFYIPSTTPNRRFHE